MDKNYTAKAAKALKVASRMATKLHHNYIGTEHLLLGLLKEGTGVAACVLMENGVEEKKLVSLIEELIAPSSGVLTMEKDGYSPKALKVLEASKALADRFENEEIGTEHILIAILKEMDCAAARLLGTMGANMQKLFVDTLIAMGEDASKYRDEINSGRMTSRVSATPTVDRFSKDLTQLALDGELDSVIGREDEIIRVMQILSRRTKNNPCLMGEPGVGKTAVVEGLARRIASGLVPDSIAGKRLLSLDLSGMVAGTKYRGEFEERLKKVMAEVSENRDIILFLDEIHTVIGAGGAEGALDAANILKPALSRGELQLIGATTVDEYKKHIEKDAALERRFQPVVVEEATVEHTIDILNGLKECYEKHHNVEYDKDAIEAAVKLSERYINDRFLPDKAIDLMDEAGSYVRMMAMGVKGDELDTYREAIESYEKELVDAISSGDIALASEIMARREKTKEDLRKKEKKVSKKKNTKKLVVTENDIADVVARQTKIPVKKLTESEGERLGRLEKTLHKRVVGQEEAVSAVARAVRRGRVGLKDPNRPIGSFLFLGPTGVGKTEISKALAEAVFGNESAMIRVDMSEYMEKHSVSKMIGSPPGYVGFEEGGQLAEKVRRNPYSVILFDEIEKAHPDVFNILLQVLDDGRVTDSQGRKIDFKNTIIIMTSNAGAQSIVTPKKLGFGAASDEKADYERMKSMVMEDVKKLFKPEFLNRIDETIVFSMLGKKKMRDIVSILATSLVNRCEKQMQIKLTVTSPAKDWIVEKSYDPKYGARPLKRKIQTDIEDKLAEEILAGRIKKNNAVKVSVKDDMLQFTVDKVRRTK